MKILRITAVLTVLIIVLQMRTNAQVKNYDADWKIVEDHIKKGLPASALEAVKKYIPGQKRKNRMPSW
ncbi:hypothetical protein [Niabella hibiscisoli]|uniref:hypothetical protein n=1 Tax=Niabella hibiscisoli TaxID=1825928 RepID=UPI001F0CF07B|nr:hypothetical protein [Niabella hibiscisoli]MCH5720534.1 hypothetical protein [Niabella hibiscisoli]